MMSSKDEKSKIEPAIPVVDPDTEERPSRGNKPPRKKALLNLAGGGSGGHGRGGDDGDNEKPSPPPRRFPYRYVVTSLAATVLLGWIGWVTWEVLQVKKSIATTVAPGKTARERSTSVVAFRDPLEKDVVKIQPLGYAHQTPIPIQAPWDGTVTSVSWQGAWGTVEVEAYDYRGYKARYGLLEEVKVKQGDWVDAGEVIGSAIAGVGLTFRIVGPTAKGQVMSPFLYIPIIVPDVKP